MNKLGCKIESFPRCWIRNIAKKNNLDYQKIKKILRPCYTWIAQLTLDCFGNARLCPTGGFILGNIIEDGIEWVWQKNKVIQEFRTFKWLGRPCIDTERGIMCNDFYYCSGGCRRSKSVGLFNADQMRLDL